MAALTPAKTVQLAANRMLTAADGATPNPAKVVVEAALIREQLEILVPVVAQDPPLSAAKAQLDRIEAAISAGFAKAWSEFSEIDTTLAGLEYAPGPDGGPPILVPPAPVETPPPPPPEVDLVPPNVIIDPVVAHPDAKFVAVPVRLSKATPYTIRTSHMVYTGNNPDPAKNAYPPVFYTQVTKSLTWNPGDPLVQHIIVPVVRAFDGMEFRLVTTGSNDPNWIKATGEAKIIFDKAAALPTMPAPYVPRPRLLPDKGEASFRMDLENFKASRTGYLEDGKTPCWKTQHPHGDYQAVEPVVYTDPVFHPGTKSWEIRDNALVLRLEALKTPLYDVAGMPKMISASVLTTQTLHWQQFGYFEFIAKVPKKDWPGLWLHGGPGITDEIDLSEFFKGMLANMIHVGIHHALLKTWARVFTNDFFAGLDVSAEFHKFGCSWRSDFITFFFDDVAAWQTVNPGMRRMYSLMDLTAHKDTRPESLPVANEMAVKSYQIWK